MWFCFFRCCRIQQQSHDREGRAATADETLSQHSQFLDLAADLKRRIADFLFVRDALRLCRTAKIIQQELGLVVRPPFRMMQATYWRDELESWNTTPRVATIVPVLYGERTHSITLNGHWCDQEGGNEDCKLYVVAHPQEDEDICWNRGTVVAESNCARQSTTVFSLSVRPRPRMFYYLWYKVGGGPGHQVYISDILVHAVVST